MCNTLFCLCVCIFFLHISHHAKVIGTADHREITVCPSIQCYISGILCTYIIPYHLIGSGGQSCYRSSHGEIESCCRQLPPHHCEGLLTVSKNCNCADCICSLHNYRLHTYTHTHDSSQYFLFIHLSLHYDHNLCSFHLCVKRIQYTRVNK